MDELTMERFGSYLPLRELTAQPPPRRGWPVVDWRVIDERQRILNDALAPKRRAA